jgi:hypothetical protein
MAALGGYSRVEHKSGVCGRQVDGQWGTLACSSFVDVKTYSHLVVIQRQTTTVTSKCFEQWVVLLHCGLDAHGKSMKNMPGYITAKHLPTGDTRRSLSACAGIEQYITAKHLPTGDTRRSLSACAGIEQYITAKHLPTGDTRRSLSACAGIEQFASMTP